jgi:hypothetical protein
MLFYETRFTCKCYSRWGCYAMKFVSDYSNNNTKKLISQQNDSQESKEPDYDEENTDKQGEEEQEEQTGEITSTTNQVF